MVVSEFLSMDDVEDDQVVRLTFWVKRTVVLPVSFLFAVIANVRWPTLLMRWSKSKKSRI